MLRLGQARLIPNVTTIHTTSIRSQITNSDARVSNLKDLFPKKSLVSPFTFDISVAAATYVKFLHLNSVLPYDEEDFIHKSVNRYKKYFQLAQEVYKRENLEGLQNIVPTRDISFIWATHMIHPHSYRQWRKTYFDGCEGKKLALNTWFSNQYMRGLQNNNKIPIKKQKVVKEWKEKYEKTNLLWKELFDEDYLFQPRDLFLNRMSKKSSLFSFLKKFSKLPEQKILLPKDDLTNDFGIDLHSAAERHLRFSNRVIKLHHVIKSKNYFETAADRYFLFLSMFKEHNRTFNGPLVPTLDIDIMWHTHMLSPVNYFPECQIICGKVLDHNDEMGDSTLNDAFLNTQKTWEKKYRTPMVSKEKPKKDDGYYGASCTSCGFGDSHYHSTAHHQAYESAVTSDMIDLSESPHDDLFEDIESSDTGFSWDSMGDGSSDASSSSCSSCSSCGGD